MGTGGDVLGDTGIGGNQIIVDLPVNCNAPDDIAFHRSEPDGTIRSQGDARRLTRWAAKRVFRDVASRGNLADLADTPLGKPEIPISTARDAKGIAVARRKEELPDLPGRSNASDLVSVGLGKPEIAVLVPQ